MWRSGYDVIFFRVVCVSLVAIAFLFTVILTNVFVDVDGFFTSKAKNELNNKIDENTSYNKMKEDHSNEDQNSNDVSGYRARRSLEYNENFPHVKNPNLKKVLNKQLAVLLEELDEEETLTTKPTDEPDRSKFEKMDKISNDVSEEDLHRSLHEILLEGITDHMDFGAIYDKIKNMKKASKEVIKRQKERSNEEHLLINEIVKCKKLAGDVEQLNTNEQNTKTTEATTMVKKHKDHNVIVKSEVQIWNENNKHNYTKGNINGFIKMIYNGKLVNLSQMQNELDSILKGDNKQDIEEVTTKRGSTDSDTYPVVLNNNNDINTLLKRFFRKDIDLHNTERIRHKPRHKRQVKDEPSDTTTDKPAAKNTKSDKHIDIEIETQFDGKDIKGGRKQFINHLIEKIKRALSSDTEVTNYKSEVTFVKRIQDPIVVTELSVFKSKFSPPFEKIERREVDHINKFLNREENTYNKVEDVWTKSNNKPKFLTASKSVNSAEMQKVNINYDQVLRNGIAKRFQKPITDNTEETDDATSRIYSNLGNVSLLLKDIIGTGFSIGYNQYLDDPPDKDSLKAFNGLENLIKEYHNTYDYGDTNNQIVPNELSDAVKAQHEISKRNAGNRKKVIVNVKKITNLKSKLKMNRYINTNIMAKNRLFLKNKRHKRHLDNIRIIASDKILPFLNGSDEDMYIISRDDKYSDRPSFIKESNMNEVIKSKSEEIYDENIPADDIYHEQRPMVQSFYEINPYESQLMSKYPHIFAEADTNQRSLYDNALFKGERNARIGHLSERPIIMAEDKILPDSIHYIKPEVLPGVEDIMNAIIPKSRYKVTLKIIPQNNNTNTGFKEIHTSVNKSYDKDGLHYFSLVNVSEISKVEKLNQTSEVHKADILNEESKKTMERKKILTQQKRKVDEQLTKLIDESKKLDKIIHSLGGHNKELYIRSPKMYIDSETYNENKAKTKGTVNTGDDTKNIKQFKRESKAIFDELQTLKLFKRNENVTAEILKRIDSNTNMLQAFLDKLYNNVQLVQKNDEANKKKLVETTPPIPRDLNKPTKSYDLVEQNDQIVTARVGSLIVPISNILNEEQEEYKRIGKHKDFKQALIIQSLINSDNRRRLNKTNFFYG